MERSGRRRSPVVIIDAGAAAGPAARRRWISIVAVPPGAPLAAALDELGGLGMSCDRLAIAAIAEAIAALPGAVTEGLSACLSHLALQAEPTPWIAAEGVVHATRPDLWRGIEAMDASPGAPPGRSQFVADIARGGVALIVSSDTFAECRRVARVLLRHGCGRVRTHHYR
jgi:hypothetical protein